MAQYGWLISADFIKNRFEPVLHYGPSGTRYRPTEIIDGDQFRLYDQKGKLCYEGKIFGSYSGTEPLDDFGWPKAKCTVIRYRDPETDEWVDH